MKEGHMTTEAITVREPAPALTLKEVRDQTQLVVHLLKEVFKEGTHYGVIPGTPKPSLWKPGAEKALSMFKIAVTPVVTDLSGPDEIRYRVEACARHYVSGTDLGSAYGEASSSEEKYKWREAVCEEEWEATSPERRRIKFKKGRWDTKLRINGPATQVKQVRTEPADVANTILKMAAKRAEVAVTLRVTAASDIFTQDVEDLPEELRGTVTDAPTMAEPERTDAPEPVAKSDQPAPVTNPRQTGASAEVPSPKSTPAPSGPAPVYLITEAVVKTSGESARGPWTLYGIKTKDGKEFTTFSDTIFETAQNAKELDIPCRITSEKTKKGNDQIATLVVPVEDPA
jgi:hypothetical protein